MRAHGARRTQRHHKRCSRCAAVCCMSSSVLWLLPRVARAAGAPLCAVPQVLCTIACMMPPTRERVAARPVFTDYPVLRHPCHVPLASRAHVYIVWARLAPKRQKRGRGRAWVLVCKFGRLIMYRAQQEIYPGNYLGFLVGQGRNHFLPTFLPGRNSRTRGRKVQGRLGSYRQLYHNRQEYEIRRDY